MKLEILYEDEDYIIINKAAGVLVIPDRFNTQELSLNHILEKELDQKIWVVHRLDRNTSGCICFAKNAGTHQYLSGLFSKNKLTKIYKALVIGKLPTTKGIIQKPIAEHPVKKGRMVIHPKGKTAQTDYEVLEEWPLYSLVKLRLHTGRTHQIRVHLQAIGHPVVCDELYGDGKGFYLSNIKKNYKLSNKYETEKPLLGRQALHAFQLSFQKENGVVISVEAGLPKDMAACIHQLNKWSH